MQSRIDYSSKFVTDTHPLSLLAEAPRGCHIVLFHEEDRSGEALEFWYLLHGLVRSEHGIYLTLDDPEIIRDRMKKRGIDVDYYEKDRDLLHIRQFEDPTKHPRGFTEGLREMYHAAFIGAKRPCRVVGASVPEVRTEEQIRLNIEVESGAMAGFQGIPGKGSVYDAFVNFHGSVLCHYGITSNFTEAQNRWIVQNQECHHVAIFAPKSRKLQVVASCGGTI
jgi:hypothetical protein